MQLNTAVTYRAYVYAGLVYRPYINLNGINNVELTGIGLGHDCFMILLQSFLIGLVGL